MFKVTAPKIRFVADRFSQRKYKIPNCQQGYAYLTSLRVCYVDEKEPRKNSVALDLQEVDKVEYQVCVQSSGCIQELNFRSGRLLEIFPKDHVSSKAAETWPRFCAAYRQ